jgi:hypothetical protein
MEWWNIVFGSLLDYATRNLRIHGIGCGFISSLSTHINGELGGTSMTFERDFGNQGSTTGTPLTFQMLIGTYAALYT